MTVNWVVVPPSQNFVKREKKFITRRFAFVLNLYLLHWLPIPLNMNAEKLHLNWVSRNQSLFYIIMK